MNPEQSLEFLETLRANYYLLSEQVDLELMSSDSRDRLIRQNSPARPYLQAAWFGR
jgi:hypothetical protein